MFIVRSLPNTRHTVRWKAETMKMGPNDASFGPFHVCCICDQMGVGGVSYWWPWWPFIVMRGTTRAQDTFDASQALLLSLLA